MADTRYLKKRRQGWYAQVPIPRDLRDQMGSNPIVRSLQTRDLTVAQRRRWVHVTAANEEFDRLRRAGGRELLPVEIEERASEVYVRTLKEAEDAGLDEDGIYILLDHREADIRSGKLNELEQAEAWAAVAALNGRVAALHGRLYQPPTHFGPRGIDPVTLQPVARRRRATGAPSDALRFSDAARQYLDETQRDPDAKLTAQTVAQSEAVYRLFTYHCQDAPLSDITRAMASDFLSQVSTLSPYWGRNREAKKRTLAELLERYGGHTVGLSNRTVNRYATSLSVVYKWAKKRGHHDGDNPFEGQTRRKATSRETGWRPFEPDELVALLAGMQPVVSPGKHTGDTALAWITWIGAYSGMRLNEICSLDVGDIGEEDGVWFFNVTGAKTAAGDRRIPVHSVLVKIGLLDYRKRLAKGSMWPALKPGGPDGKLSWGTTKRFLTWRQSRNLTGDRLTFHSLRKNVGTALERAEVPESEAVQILGHEKLSMSYSVYSLGLDLGGLQRVVEQIVYEGVKV